ncbi:helix-turn-helix transcriptional regulator [Candidatus Desantisbacteria bacterium]|nr:helix-turn-helix transcriptional regulator [Candidatus Desantisbacteria bacterium]
MVGILIGMKIKCIITSEDIGKKIKKRRRGLGISQENLAEILDVTYQQVQRYENGKNRLNVENIQMIADALSVPVSYFFESNETAKIGDTHAPYAPSEENKLLKYFKKIKTKKSKDMVIQVTKLASKKKS